jgi:NRAMP (natural resistance-associated macrophage protein)-like metal ion transporter
VPPEPKHGYLIAKGNYQMGDKQSNVADSGRDVESKQADRAGQGDQKEAAKIGVGIVMEVDECDLGQEDIGGTKVIGIVINQAGALAEPNMEKKDKKDKPAQKPDDVVEATDTTSVLQGIVDDHADIQNAHAESREQLSNKSKSLLRIGPGLITGVADDDPSGIGTYSVAGAQFGYQLLWLAPVCVPLMIAVQEMCGRIALVTSKGLSAVIKENYSKLLLYSVLVLLVGANTINVYADINIMAASMKMLFGLQFALWATVLTIGIVVAQITVPYKYYVKFLKYACLSLLAYVVIAVLPKVHVDWNSVVSNMVTPQWNSSPGYILTIVGFLGTTISPYLFFWQAGEQIEDDIADGLTDDSGYRASRIKSSEIRSLRSDTAVGMIFSQIVTIFIIVSTAATLHVSGKTDINSAEDAARALLPLGASAYWLFTLGILGVGLLAIPTLAGSAAYAVAETAGWRNGLYRRFSRARGFYTTITLVIVAGYLLNFVQVISPVKALLYSAVLNGLVAPPLIIVLLFICNNRKIMGKDRNGWLSNTLGWLAVIIMTVAGGLLIWSLFTGKTT